MWRSPVARFVRDEEAVGSNPITPTIKYYVYILASQKITRYYVEHTQDLERRLQEHNSGQTKSTKSGIPWIHVYKEEFATRSEAMKFENKIKKKKSRKYIEELISARQ